jgi:pimeloyl-ACP methyl ester carboxylesterase
VKVVYLHGFASGPTSSKARFFREKFAAAGIDVAIPALDGGDFRNLTITSQLAVIERQVHGERVTLMGSSLGGYLAALYAAAHPNQVDHVIMMAPAFCFARRWSAELPAHEEWKRTGLTEIFHYGEQRTIELSYNLIADGLEYEDYPDVRQPALILHGALDPIVPVWLSEEFVKRHPANARLQIYPQSGHELTDVVEDMWTEISCFLDLKSDDLK